MIMQYRFTLGKNTVQLGASLAYPLYAWLLSHFTKEEGDLLHLQDTRPISQYVYHNLAAQCDEWTVNLLTKDAVRLFAPALDEATEASLHSSVVSFCRKKITCVERPHTLIEKARAMQGSRFTLTLLSPTAFKQDGRYVIYPQEQLILQSLVNRWGLCFPDIPLDDVDATRAILQGLHITDYRLQTLRYAFKQTRIPSFQGRVILEARMPAPLMEVWKTLYCFAPYAGLGIKTALGMGGVGVESEQD